MLKTDQFSFHKAMLKTDQFSFHKAI